MYKRQLQVDTTNILFICAGTFTGIDSLVRNRSSSSLASKPEHFAMRQEHVPEKAEIEKIKEAFRLMRPEDLIEFGMIPELLGRLPILATLDPLEENDLVRVLQEPRDALVKQYQKLFSLNDTSLLFTPNALREIARLAIERKTGARALRSILEEVMLDVLYELPNHKGKLKEFVVNKRVVEKKTFAAGKQTWVEVTGKKEENKDEGPGHRKTA